jgi:hypothetical protein
MDEDFNPELDLDSNLLGTVDVFEQTVLRRYESEEDAKVVVRVAEAIVTLLRETLSGLADAEYAELWRDLHTRLDERDLAEDVRFALQADLARQIIDTDGMASRCMKLLTVIARAKPPENVVRFLRRVSRCYVFGFSPECMVMCRAGFENALNARYQMEETPYPSDAEGRQTMRLRVQGAVDRGWLDAQLAQEAFQVVWGRGNKAAHGDPDAVGTPFEAIQLTMRSIEELHAPPFEPTA